MNKCPKCGYQYNEKDVFCAMCGNRLIIEEIQSDDELNKQIGFLDIQKNIQIGAKKSIQFFNVNNKNFFDNFALNFVFCLIIVCFVLSGVLYNSVSKHEQKRVELQYKNLLNNPQQIPELKQPKTFALLMQNLRDVERFLQLYLQFSTDEQTKKEQIFTSYLKEMDKLSNFGEDSIGNDTIKKCTTLKTPNERNICAKELNKLYNDIGASVYSNGDTLYFYPDYFVIYKKYKKYLSPDLKDYLEIRAKYQQPTSIGLDLFISPKLLVDKIYDYENLLKKTSNIFVKEELEKIIYDDFRKLIFTPSIYATTTQEMNKEFKTALIYFLKTKKDSALYPVVMSYMDKKRSYSDKNLKNDYPYKMYESSFKTNVINSALNDIFSQLRKNIFSKNSKYVFAYVYNIQNGAWVKYAPNSQIMQNEFIMSEIDENNNTAIYSNTFSLLQELNIPKYGKLYLINNQLFIYNSDNLSLSKIAFNGRNFTVQRYSSSDITSLFPGIEVINIDSYSNYNIRLTKDNQSASYIVLSRYSQGYNQYMLSALKGQINKSVLPNMFSVTDNNEVIVSFHFENLNPDITSDSAPTYKFKIKTRKAIDESVYDAANFVNYDEKTAKEEKEKSNYLPNIMPKIIKENEEINNTSEVKEDELIDPPTQNITPPKDIDKKEKDSGSIFIEVIE